MKLLKRMLGRCVSCWRRSEFTCDVVARDLDGVILGKPERLSYCKKHTQFVLDSMIPISDEAEVEYENGLRVRYRNAPREDT